MKSEASSIHFSPTDLSVFVESEFACWMNRFAVDHPEVKPGRDHTDAEALLDGNEFLKRRGDEHEREVLESLRAEGRDVCEISTPDRVAARKETLAAMAAGRDVIYQAHLVLGPLNGIADFLIRSPGESSLGDFHYQAWDAKLAHRVKPGHVIQLCAYSEMLEADQGRLPDGCGVLLGTGERPELRVADYLYFYRALKRRFLDFLRDYDEAHPPLPDPSANHRDWQEEADRRLEAVDHISRVARVSARQIERLGGVEIDTLNGLADSKLEVVPGIAGERLERLKEQAGLQRDSAGLDRPRFRVLARNEVPGRQGLAILPPPSPGDVFFDLEGNPLADGGLEYLWGAVHLDSHGEPAYRDWWAHDARDERRALQEFVDWASERLAQHPDMHIYHYAAYETSALKRLAAREATREAELDALLRAQVFVDLYAVVSHGVRVGEPSYSLKNVERLYLEPRATEVASGMESVAYYEAWAATGESRDRREAPLLEKIRAYNEDDCRSTHELARWLWDRQAEAGIPFEPPKPPDAPTSTEEKNQRTREERAALAEEMIAELPPAEEREEEPERWRIHELLAQLLQFHHREFRPVWWDLFHRAEMTEDERAEQPDCLAGLERLGEPSRIKSSLGFECRFDPEQDTKIGVGDTCRIAQHERAAVKVEEKDDAEGRIVLKATKKALAKGDLETLPDRLCLVRFDMFPTEGLEAAIAEVCRGWRETGDIPAVLRSLLLRRAPALDQDDEDVDAQFLNAARGLNGDVLAVQGPPGSGKTTKAAQVICALRREGKRIGITSNSHKAVVNLMKACAEANGGRIDCAKIQGDDEEEPTFPGVVVGKSNEAADLLAQTGLIGGTAWCFARNDLVDKLDYLFVDEAGQVSLANVAAMSRSARNIVLLGDQMQLSQPTRGTHPGESGHSALDYALAGHHVIPPDRGIFLPSTYRLHPRVCDFISDTFYEGKLHPAPGNERRELGAGPEGGVLADVRAGVVFVPVEHRGNRQASREEVKAIVSLTEELVGRPYKGRKDGTTSPIRPDDILIVAPYNLQRLYLEDALPDFKIGTVDKFQGQEAPIVLVSMCASDASQSPRGMGFLLDPNRLNVAISRAHARGDPSTDPFLETVS